MAGQKYQVLARYFPHRDDGTDQEHKFVTGNSRAELVAAAQQACPPGDKLYLACIWARYEGPLIWTPPNFWLPEAGKYVPR